MNTLRALKFILMANYVMSVSDTTLYRIINRAQVSGGGYPRGPPPVIITALQIHV